MGVPYIPGRLTSHESSFEVSSKLLYPGHPVDGFKSPANHLKSVEFFLVPLIGTIKNQPKCW